MGDDLGAGGQLVGVLIVGDDLYGGEDGSLVHLAGRPKVGGQGGEGGGSPRPHCHR